MIPLSVPNLSKKEKIYLKECIDTQYVSSVGRFVSLFENKIAKFTKCKYAIACNSGTSAIQLALRVAGIKKDDEVIVPSMTFIATANAVRYLGARPIFADCDGFLNIDFDKTIKFLKKNTFFKKGFTYNRKTKNKISAIIPVHVNGNAVNLEKSLNFLKKRKIKIIEDAAEALGTFYSKGKLKGKHAGTIGNLGCLSFNGNKIITSGGGGMIITNNKKYAKYAKYLSTQATDDNLTYTHNDIGYNFRLTNIQAAVGLAQLEKINLFLRKKKQILQFYKKHLEDVEGIEILKTPHYANNNNWLISLLINSKKYKKTKNQLLNLLKKKGIQSRPMWKPVHKQKPYKKFQKLKINKADELHKNILNIPCSTNLSKKDQISVIKEIKNNQ